MCSEIKLPTLSSNLVLPQSSPSQEMKIRSSQLLSKGLGIIFDASLSFPLYIQSVNESKGTT